MADENYYCELRLNPEGFYQIGPKTYKPRWPRGLPERLNTQIAEDLIIRMIAAGKNYFEETGVSPVEIQAERLPDGTLETAIVIEH